MLRKKLSLLILATTTYAFVAVVLLGCPSPQDQVNEPKSQPASEEYIARAVNTWDAHLKVLEDAVEGRPHSDEDLMRAGRFFRELTGIEIRGEGSYVGWLATSETREDLNTLREWFLEHGNDLRWDSKKEQVFLAGSDEG